MTQIGPSGSLKDWPWSLRQSPLPLPESVGGAVVTVCPTQTDVTTSRTAPDRAAPGTAE